MAFEDYNLDTPRTQGYGFARVQRLAVQHLLGAR
jgi:xylose isomerase